MNRQAVNWNNIEDPFDKIMWDQLNEQFWLDTRLPLSKDYKQWQALSDREQDLYLKVFGGLTLLDTTQAETGVPAIMGDAITKHEYATYTQIQYMEEIHAKFYSSAEMTLATSKQIYDTFAWIEEDPILQWKANRIIDVYQQGTALEKKIASVFLESFLFYSGFYLPLYYAGQNKMINVAEGIKLILRDESAHGFYVGYKFQIGYELLADEKEKERLTNWAYTFLMELYDNEVAYTERVYEGTGMVEDVKIFLRYNANKALLNLGFDPLFPEETVNPVVLNGMSTASATHDFFSTVGSSYRLQFLESLSKADYHMFDQLEAPL